MVATGSTWLRLSWATLLLWLSTHDWGETDKTPADSYVVSFLYSPLPSVIVRNITFTLMQR